MRKGYAMGKISVRRDQLRMLAKGNGTACVWLGKQILGQRDYNSFETDKKEPVPFVVEVVQQDDEPEDPDKGKQ